MLVKTIPHIVCKHWGCRAHAKAMLAKMIPLAKEV
jgi:hypothetical protein